MDIHALLQAWSKESQPAVIATMIGASGHSYRKIGAVMLLTRNHRTYGSLSPGCIEADLKERVSHILLQGQPEVILYNMQPEEDAMWGEMTGCGGTIEILLEPITEQLQSLLSVALHQLQQGKSVAVERAWNGMQWSYQAAEADNGAQPYFTTNHCLSIWHPQPRLILFGAGNDAIPICQLAVQSGFRVTVADWRSTLCTTERFPEAELLLAGGTISDMLAELQLTSADYLVLCSHQLHQDREMLKCALLHRLHYIGIIGSRKRIAMLFEDQPIPEQVHAPIGCDIGADGPYEIAVSIAAQLIAVRRGKVHQIRRSDAYDSTYSSDLFGGRFESPYGRSEADIGAVFEQHARQSGSSCAVS